MKYLSGCVTVFLAMATAAQGATLFASGKLYGGSGQNIAACYLFNAGTKPVKISDQAIRDEAGNAQGVDSTCPHALPAGSGCLLEAPYDIDYSSAYDCEFVLSSTAGVRGSLEIREDDGGGPAVLQSQALR